MASLYGRVWVGKYRAKREECDGTDAKANTPDDRQPLILDDQTAAAVAQSQKVARGLALHPPRFRELQRTFRQLRILSQSLENTTQAGLRSSRHSLQMTQCVATWPLRHGHGARALTRESMAAKGRK